MTFLYICRSVAIIGSVLFIISFIFWSFLISRPEQQFDLSLLNNNMLFVSLHHFDIRRRLPSRGLIMFLRKRNSFPFGSLRRNRVISTNKNTS